MTAYPPTDGLLLDDDFGAVSSALSGPSKAPKMTQASRLLKMAEEAELFHAADATAYATIEAGDHKENWPLRSKSFKRWISHRYHLETGAAPGGQALQDALLTLEGKAVYQGPEHPVHIRVAEAEGNVYIDLGDDKWRAVEITPTREGWSVIQNPPVKFRRTRGMAPLPYPVLGGCVEDLRPFVNLQSEEDWQQLVAWILSALRPQGPFPLLRMQGEQGSGKSGAARRAKQLVDPSVPAHRAEPRNGHELLIAATNSWVLSFDNLSFLPAWLSDALCRLSTGGGFAARELYSDGEEALFDAKRPTIINGIEDIVSRGDLLDRVLTVQMPSIPEGKRKAEKDLDREFEDVHPKIFGAFLTVASGALRNLPDMELPNLPRMADFALWIAAAEEALEWAPGTFDKAYTGSREEAHNLALESSAVGAKVREIVSNLKGTWQGTAGELLVELTDLFPNGGSQLPKGWPKNARAMSGQLRRVAPHLRAAGVQVTQLDREPGTGRRLICIEEGPRPAKDPYIPSITETTPYTPELDFDGCHDKEDD